MELYIFLGPACTPDRLKCECEYSNRECRCLSCVVLPCCNGIYLWCHVFQMAVTTYNTSIPVDKRYEQG
jgi:hypothetical protein